MLVKKNELKKKTYKSLLYMVILHDVIKVAKLSTKYSHG